MKPRSKHASRNRGDWARDGIVERLGVAPDVEIAAEVGVTRQAVAYMRERLGIASCRERNALPAALVELLGFRSDRALATEFGVDCDRISSARNARGIAPYRLIGPIQIEHGTRYSYSHYFCRCTPCTAENAKQMREWVAKNPEKSAANVERQRKKVLESAPHDVGQISWYTLGCRCAGCVKAGSEYSSPKYKRSRTTSLAWGRAN